MNRIIAGLFIVLVLFSIFPLKGCENMFYSWKASAFGTDWLVIQYSAVGSPINVWELRNKSIYPESQSDGIYFLDESSNVIHLGGNYLYVQVKDWDSTRAKYLKKGE